MRSGPFRLPGVTSPQRTLLLGVGLALYGNVIALATYMTSVPEIGPVCEAVLGALVLATVGRAPGGLARLGLSSSGLGRSLWAGIAVGLLPGVILVIRAWQAGAFAPLFNADVPGPAFPGAIQLTGLFFGVALPEELAFRGLLHARLTAAFTYRKAMIIGSLCFAAWHLVVNLVTLSELGLGLNPILGLGMYFGQFAALAITGLIFGYLREWSGNLAGCVVAHWLADALLMSAFGWQISTPRAA
jgi:uncharacterized protein